MTQWGPRFDVRARLLALRVCGRRCYCLDAAYWSEVRVYARRSISGVGSRLAISLAS